MAPLRIFLAITGASGSIYAQRMLSVLLEHKDLVERIYICATKSGYDVSQFELAQPCDKHSLVSYLDKNFESKEIAKKVRVFSNEDLFAPTASGSSAPTHMIVLPCSMGSLARIAHGVSSNLIERTADVMLKQKKPLILCPRESPLSSIHLKNMLELSQMGCHIIPAMPGFYHKPKTIDDLVDFVIGKIFESCGLEHALYPQWNKRMR